MTTRSGTPLQDFGSQSPGLESDTSYAAVHLLQKDENRDAADQKFLSVDIDGPPEATEGAVTDWRKVALKVLVSLVCFILISILIEHYANDSVTRWSKAFIDKIGLPGLFLGVFLFDGLPQPFTYVPLIFMAVKGGVSKLAVFATCMMASYSAALFGYMAGSFLRGPDWGRQLFAMLEEKYPQAPDLMRRKGAIGVLLAAMLPVPLAAATWTAGFFSVDVPSFLVAAMGRGPKIVIFVALSTGPAAEHAAS